MKVVINGTTYTDISNLDFMPETDLMGNSLIVNDFSVDIRTDDEIELNRIARLCDDDGTVWARYTIIDVYNVETGVKRVIAQSAVALLAKRNKKAVMYNSESVANIIATFMNGISYTLDSSFNNMTITGYFPDQTARERLQSICFVIGAYVRAYFSESIDILPISNASELVPMKQVYWRPKAKVEDYVTKITVMSYSFVEGTPASTDEWVEANGHYYIQTSQEVSISNGDVPSYVEENEIVIKDLKIINSSNVSGILSRLTNLYFNRKQLECSVVDNGQLFPGKRIMIFADPYTIKSGYIKSSEYSFGTQKKTKLLLGMVEDVNTARLIINAVYNNKIIDRWTFVFPVSYAYSVENLYVEKNMNGHRYVFRPTTARTTGTMTAQGRTVNVTYQIALDNYEDNLYIVSVDEVSIDSGVVEVK